MPPALKCLKGVLSLPWGSANEGDPQTLPIKKYLDKLGGNANAGERSGLSTACYEVLQEPEHDELKQQTVNTIVWQDKQMILVKGTLEYLRKRVTWLNASVQKPPIGLFKDLVVMTILDQLWRKFASVSWISRMFGIYSALLGETCYLSFTKTHLTGYLVMSFGIVFIIRLTFTLKRLLMQLKTF